MKTYKISCGMCSYHVSIPDSHSACAEIGDSVIEHLSHHGHYLAIRVTYIQTVPEAV